MGRSGISDSGKLRLSIAISNYDHVRDLIDGRVRPEGIEANRHTLEAFLQYSHEQCVCHRPVTVDELFPEQIGIEFRL